MKFFEEIINIFKIRLLIKGIINRKFIIACKANPILNDLYSLFFHYIKIITKGMKLGEDVLTKIQKLITQIDRPAKIKRRSPRLKENINSNPFQKLYEEHKTKKIRHEVKMQEQLDEEKERCSPFKVTNKHSIFLNTQQQKRPLHERIEELQNRKAEELLLLREKYQPKQVVDEQEEEIIRQMEERKKSQRKFTPKEVAEKMEELRKRQKARIEKLNRLKIQIIQEHSKDFRCKPYVTKQTEAHWHRHKLKKQLSTSVFERFQQYEIERKNHLQTKQKQIRNQITPFTPKISPNSRLIVSRSTSKLDAKSRTLQRSSSCQSCRCIKMGRKINQSTAMHTSRKH